MKLDLDIFNIKANNVKPQKGRVLISEPFLQGYYFSRSIVLLTEHTSDGSMGLVLNKPLELNLGNVLRDISFYDKRLGCGGPVSPDKLFYLHNFSQVPEVVKIKNGLYFGGNFEYIKDLLNYNPSLLNDIRFFIGYAGWSPGQLEDELKEVSWLVSDIAVNNILHYSHEDMWKQTVLSLGTEYSAWMNYPSQPEMN